tara:strand:- start:39 stop:314 length:276 start_codon:yes stop_codon:yes gene_type:complete
MSVQLIATATLIQRTLERDVYGMKIPDQIVDDLLVQLPNLSINQLKQIEVTLNVNPSLYAKRAYRLWTLSDLSIGTLFLGAMSQHEWQNVA